MTRVSIEDGEWGRQEQGSEVGDQRSGVRDPGRIASTRRAHSSRPGRPGRPAQSGRSGGDRKTDTPLPSGSWLSRRTAFMTLPAVVAPRLREIPVLRGYPDLAVIAG